MKKLALVGLAMIVASTPSAWARDSKKKIAKKHHVGVAKQCSPTDEIKSSQAGAMAYSAADNQSASRKQAEKGFFSENRGIEYRPSLGVQWFAAQATRPDRTSMQASWMGLRGEFDGALVRFPIVEFGGNASFFRSLAPLTSDAIGGSATEFATEAYALFKANTSKRGIPMVRLFSGYYGNWRNSSHGVDFLGPVSGFRVGTEVSAIIDSMFGLGVSGSYTTSQRGLFDFGAFLSQRITPKARFGTWSGRFGMNLSLLRQDSPAGLRLENWLSFVGGITAAI